MSSPQPVTQSPPLGDVKTRAMASDAAATTELAAVGGDLRGQRRTRPHRRPAGAARSGGSPRLGTLKNDGKRSSPSGWHARRRTPDGRPESPSRTLSTKEE